MAVMADALPLSKRLKAATTTTHDALDERIRAGDPFRDRERFGRFLSVQYRFHRDIDALYRHPALDAVLPDLAGRRRFDLIAQDIADLGQTLPVVEEAPVFGDAPIDLPTAFGWLYVAEGSNLGAAFLFKWAAALGLDESCGARHLAGHPDGRALHWRQFTAALDALAQNNEDESRVIEGAQAAFVRVRLLVDDAFA